MTGKVMLTFTRSTHLHCVTPSNSRPTIESHNYSLPSRTNQASNNHHSTGYQGSRNHGRGGGYGNYNGRYGNHSEEGTSAVKHLSNRVHQGHHSQQQYKSVQVFTASATSASTANPPDRQEFSEPATIVWCEGGIGEVMSPTVWRHPRLHLYFDASRTTLDMKDGWSGLGTELEPGMELDVSFSISYTLLRQLQQVTAVAQTHVFVCIEKVAEPRVSKASSVRTFEQAVVIAKRECGAAFLMINSGERTVLHPNFLPLDGVRDAILEKVEGVKRIDQAEIDSPESLCVLGRSLSVRLAPSPAWASIYPTDRGVTRWALSAEPYGEEKAGRAVVMQATRHSVSLCPVEGDLASKITTLHAPIIQMTGQIKQHLQQRGSVWRFRACRELPGRAAVWRAFEILPELDSEPPISAQLIESILEGNRLIDMPLEEENLVDPCVKEELLDDLAQLQLVYAHQQVADAAAAAAVAAGGAAARRKIEEVQQMQQLQDDDDVPCLVFDSIDDILDSETFATDVFRAPSILTNEWQLLGVPPEEAAQTELEAASLPRVVAPPRTFGVFEMGDERPDMRVTVPKKKKKKRVLRPDSALSDEEEVEGRAQSSRRRLDDLPSLPDSLADLLPRDSTSTTVERLVDALGIPIEQPTEKEKRKEAKQDSKMKKHLASIDVGFVSAGADLFDLLHGGPSVPQPAVQPQPVPPPVLHPAKPPQLQPELPAQSTTLQPVQQSVEVPQAVVAPNSSTVERTESAATTPESKEVSPPPPPSVSSLLVLDRPRRPRVQILPYPPKPRYEGGWWFRRTRDLPPVVESKKKKKKWRPDEREEEEGDSAHSSGPAPSAAPAVSTPFVAIVRVPKDDMRERMRAELKKHKEAEQQLAMGVKEEKKEEDKKEMEVEVKKEAVEKEDEEVLALMEKKKEEEEKREEPSTVLVDLSPLSSPASFDPSTTSGSSSPSPQLQQSQPVSPVLQLHDDLKDLF